MKITLAEIARRSGVSKTTASFVLNNKQTSIGISPETVAKVREVMEALNYRRDEAATELARGKRRKTRVLLLSPWLNAVKSFFMNEVMRAAADYRQELDFGYGMYSPGELRQTLDKTGRSDWRVVVGTSAKDDKYLRELGQDGQIIALNRQLEGVTCFAPDNFKGGKMLAARCLAGGHYEEYVILAPAVRSDAAARRIEGLRDGLKAGKIRPRELVIGDGQTLAGSMDALLAVAGGKKTMVFAQIDSQAAECVSFLTRRGHAVPGQFGVSGFDNETLAAIMTPSISTVDSKTYELAAAAFKGVLEGTLRRGECCLFEPEVIIRESTK